MFTTANIKNLLGDLCKFKSFPAREITFEKIIPCVVAELRKFFKREKKRIRLKAKSRTNLKAAYEQYLAWKNELQGKNGSTYSLWLKYDCSRKLIKGYFKFGRLHPKVQDAIRAGKLDKKVRISDITSGNFPMIPSKQLAFFGIE